MDGADPDRWSAVAADWAELWGDFALPVWRAVVLAHGPVLDLQDFNRGWGNRLLLVRTDNQTTDERWAMLTSTLHLPASNRGNSSGYSTLCVAASTKTWARP